MIRITPELDLMHVVVVQVIRLRQSFFYGMENGGGKKKRFCLIANFFFVHPQ